MFRRKKLFIGLFILFLLVEIALIVLLGINNQRSEKFSVDFESNGGSLSVTSLTIKKGDSLDSLDEDIIPFRANYIFNGWYHDEELSYLYDLSSPVYENLVLYAKWSPDPSVIFFTITWLNEDGTILEIDPLVAFGSMPTYDGATPLKSSTVRYTYVFVGWSPQVTAATSDLSYYANYGQIEQQFMVIWEVEGVAVQIDSNVLYGTTPIFNGPTPDKASDPEYTYEFNGWNSTLSPVVSSITYVATFLPHIRTYDVYFKFGDILLYTTTAPYGATPLYEGALPTKVGDSQYSYTFSGWSPTVGAISGETTYQAQFTSVTLSYLIEWFYDSSDITPLYAELVEYGSLPVYAGSTLTKASDAQYDYTFSGWTPQVQLVTGNASYVATFASEVKKYTITFTNYDEVLLLVYYNVPYGTLISYQGATPTKAATTAEVFSFTGWTPQLNAGDVVTGNATYLADYSVSVRNYTITWLNTERNSGMTTTQVAYNTLPTAPDIILPYDNAQYHYTNGDWSPQIVLCLADATYTYLPTASIRNYTITWANAINGVSVTNSYPYGSLPTYEGLPTKAEDSVAVYNFINWTPSIRLVDEDATYTAVFYATIHRYDIIFKVQSAIILAYYGVNYGSTITYIGSTPTLNTPGYTNVFSGWSDGYFDGITVTQNKTYYAQFTTTPNTYTITWINADGDNGLTTTQVAYNTLPTAPNVVQPTDSVEYYYLEGEGSWSPQIDLCSGNTTYTFIPVGHLQTYTITWSGYNADDFDETTMENYLYGEVPLFPGVITLPLEDNYFTYDYGDWSPNVVAVNGDQYYSYVSAQTAKTYTVTWLLAVDEELLVYTDVPYYTQVAYNGATPYLDESHQFLGWSATQDGDEPLVFDDEAFYIVADTYFWAIFSEVPVYYTVLFKYHSTILDEQIVAFHDGALAPALPQAPDYYVWSNWSLDFSDVTSDLVVYAIFTSVFSLEISGEDAYINGYNDVRGYQTLYIPSTIDVCEGASDLTYNILGIRENTFGLQGHGITHLIIADSLILIEEGALRGLRDIIELTIPFVGLEVDSDFIQGSFPIVFGMGNATTYYDDYYTINGYVLPESLQSVIVTRDVDIASYAFFALHVTSVSLPETLVTIEEAAFQASSLTSIIIPSQVLAINENVFYQCEDLVNVYLGSGVTSIGMSAFEDATSLSYIHLGTNLMTIGSQAFQNSALVVVDIPNSVITLGASSFAQIPTLTNVTLGSSVEIIGARAFYASHLVSIVLPASLKTIGPSAWENSYLLTDIAISEGVELIDEKAFANTNISSIIIPNSVEALGCYLFDSTNLVTLSIPFVGTSIDDASNGFGILFNESSEELAGYHNANGYHLPDSLTTVIITRDDNISDFAFKSCTSLNVVILPDSVTSIGVEAFSGCNNLTSVDFGSDDSLLVNIDDRAFDNCNSLVQADLPVGLNNIGDAAFAQCWALAYLDLGQSLTYISANAFLGDYSLIYLDIPDSVLVIGEFAFLGCENLRFVQLGNNVTEIAMAAFSDNYALESIVLPDSIQFLGYHAFYNDHSLTSFTIPDTINRIGNYILEGAYSIHTITTPMLDFVNSNGDRVAYLFGFSDYTGAYYNDAGYYLPLALTTINITSGTEIVTMSFAGHYSVTTINLPDTITQIFNAAFYNCTNLTSLNLNLPNLQWIDAGALAGLEKLETLGIPFVGTSQSSMFSSIFGEIFNGDPTKFYTAYDLDMNVSNYLPNSLREVTIGANRDYIGYEVFFECYSIQKIVLSWGLHVINAHSFYNLSNLNSINIPSSVTTIGDGAFGLCTSLPQIYIPSSVTSIGELAFEYCTSLTSITLSEGLVILGASVFAQCFSLTSLVIPNSVQYIGDFLLDRTRSLQSLSVPFTGNERDPDSTSDERLSKIFGTTADTGLYELTPFYIYVPYSLTTLMVTDDDNIGSLGVQDFISLTNVVLSDGIEILNQLSFAGCINLVSIVLPYTLGHIGTNAFQNCTSLRNIVLPPNLLVINDDAFAGCSSLETIAIPNSVTTIGVQAFQGCSNLVSVTLPSVNEYLLGPSAFKNCSSLTNITLNRLAYLENSTFNGCSSLAFVFITVETILIQNFAFDNNPNLHIFTNLIGPIASWHLPALVQVHYGITF
jgi:uncharacterized repeat protein (TIGR02543 family)